MTNPVTPQGPRSKTESAGIGAPPDDLEADLPVLQSLKEQDRKRNAIVGLVVGLVMWQLTRFIPGFGITMVVLAVPFGIGAAVGRYALRSRPGLRSLAAWFGLVAWLLPLVGMLISGAVFVGQDPKRPLTRERILATLAILLSIGNATLGAIAKRG